MKLKWNELSKVDGWSEIMAIKTRRKEAGGTTLGERVGKDAEYRL